ncbi:hypothetical protein WKW79_17435 [Variovorax robiniae]|uniref:Uncharacterized protein n=1 Tax=Variovorax robiniae TaxID=1836199 RepID=A0ABU8X986_9BURK
MTNRRPTAVLRNNEAQQQPTTKATHTGGFLFARTIPMTTPLITLSAPAVVTVIVASNADDSSKFDVLVDGEAFDSFGTFAAAMRDALSIFNARVELLH